MQTNERQRGALAQLEPRGLAGRRQRTVWKCQSQSFRHHLRRSRGPEKLTSAARRAARSTSHLGGVVETDEIVRESRAEALDLTRVLGAGGGECVAARQDDSGKGTASGQSEHRRRKTFVARRDSHDAGSRRQRPNE